MFDPLELKIPSKTFLLGEYAVLQNDKPSALLANTEPYFKVRLEDASNQLTPMIGGISACSPLRKLFQDNKLSLVFEDPYQQQGGFGASGAEWIAACYGLTCRMDPNELKDISAKKIYEFFKAHRQSKESGVDILSQCTGLIALIDNGQCYQSKWSFDDLHFAIIRSGLKVNTHGHLDQVTKKGFEPLITMAEKGISAFRQKKSEAFINCINDYRNILKRLDLFHPNSETLFQKIMDSDLFISGKGCGALGLDTLVLFYSSKKAEAAKAHLNMIGYPPVATEADLTTLDDGVHILCDLL